MINISNLVSNDIYVEVVLEDREHAGDWRVVEGGTEALAQRAH